jgi:hypothetical protein
MGNATKHSPPRVLSPVRNVQPTINRINARLAQLKRNATNLRNAHRRMGNRIGNGNFYESDMIQLGLMERRARELMREKKTLERTRQNLISYQLSRGFPRAG